ncbi:MAG: hypothetical protein P9C36_02800 [Defluviicoccus sp.]|nr:hypothetical protein [Defluviicoccus sp.]MDG4591537.1 hypothetical protein [Defluviicoccus sp.]
MRARAEWHFGGGPRYCGTCAALNQPCAKGAPGANGSRCPYVEHEPLTDVGWQAWDVILRCSGQLRLAPHASIIIGIDMTAALSLGAALGYDAGMLAELLPAAELGLVTALNARMSEDCP